MIEDVVSDDKGYKRRMSSGIRKNEEVNYNNNNNYYNNNNNIKPTPSYVLHSQLLSPKPQKSHPSSSNTEQPTSSLLLKQTCQSILFSLSSQIQKKLPCLTLSHYLHPLIHHPQIFRVTQFYTKLLQCQPLSTGRQFLSQLIEKWIENQMRFFNILEYFEIFIEMCLLQEEEEQILLLIQTIPIGKIAKFHLLILKQTFDETEIIPKTNPVDGWSIIEKINLLTSGGYEEKTRFIDKYFTTIEQITLWREYISYVVMSASSNNDIHKYVHFKVYFTIVSYQYFSNCSNSVKNQSLWTTLSQNVAFMIEKLKVDIEKDRVEEVCAGFHYIMLALSQFHGRNQHRNNLQQKQNNHDPTKSFSTSHLDNNPTHPSAYHYQHFIKLLLSILQQKQQTILSMYKNKQSLIFKTLSSMSHPHQNISQQQRRQISKSLKKAQLIHVYLIKLIIRFYQSIQFDKISLKNFSNPQQYIQQTVQNYCKSQILTKQYKYQTNKYYYTAKLVYKMSQVASEKVFENVLRKQLKRYENSELIKNDGGDNDKNNDGEMIMMIRNNNKGNMNNGFYSNNNNNFYDRYLLLVMVRQIVMDWINNKINQFIYNNNPNNLNNLNSNNPSSSFPNKSSKQLSTKSKSSTNKSTQLTSFSSSLIPIQKTIQICLSTLNLHPKTHQSTHKQSDILKWKLLSLQILKQLHLFIKKYEHFLIKQQQNYHQNDKNSFIFSYKQNHHKQIQRFSLISSSTINLSYQKIKNN